MPTFRSKNQLAQKGLSCVALVVIPALATSLDKSLKEDKSLYPVRTLSYYLAGTKDLCKGKNLVFVPFRKNSIRILFRLPSLPGSRKLCCSATSFLVRKPKACIKSEPMVFEPLLLPRHSQGGVSLDQILSACSWKVHNTFTQFYLKDVAWADWNCNT